MTHWNRPRAILDIIKSGEDFRIAISTKMPEQGTCERCGYISSQVEMVKSLHFARGTESGFTQAGYRAKPRRKW
ncbi:hypothetical protein RJ639_035890 [Escallonia herrerae]|uniref:Uncharacterized protein n=1 Tax=Escallonia herrerae TaxID=1293975 RepID=A0AA88WRX7_9ASTE|nr:hypothetical protein RJ639_035890 [Escallonia herrerae]